MNKHKGFTLVEIVIVIVVIGILAAISIVTYSGMRSNAMDGKIRSVVKTSGDAMALFESQNHGSLKPGQGTFDTANGMDSLVPKYLQTDYRNGLTSNKAANTEAILRWYACNPTDGSRGIVVYAALNNPKDQDIANFNKLRSYCQHGETQAPTSGTSIYSYAQLF